MQRSALFIDAGYLKKLTRSRLHDAKVDFNFLFHALSEPTELIQTYYYDCYPYQSVPPSLSEIEKMARKQRFFIALSRIPKLNVRLGRLERFGTPPLAYYRPRRFEGLIAVDALTLAFTRQIDQMIFVAGNADYCPILRAVRGEGVKVILWHGPKGKGTSTTVHEELWVTADERHELQAGFLNSLLPTSSMKPIKIV